MTSAAVIPPAADADTVRAFVKSIHSLDASRRVGWAKLFAALERSEQVERDLERALKDLALLSKFGGFTYGALQGLGLHDIYREFLQGDHTDLAGFFPGGPIRAGRDSGERWKTEFQSRIAGKVGDRAKALKQKLQDQNARFFAAAQEKAIESLIERFGFTCEAEFFSWLSKYDGAAS